MISYMMYPNSGAAFSIGVFLDRKIVGYISRSPEGYYYETQSGHRGEVFKTVAEVKASLEAE